MSNSNARKLKLSWGKLKIVAFPCVTEYKNSLFQYIDRKYLLNKNNQKYYYYWTNFILHFNKPMTSTSKDRNANMKPALKSILRDLLEVVKVIRKMIEDWLCKICLQHSSYKNGNIWASLNIGIFCYLKHKSSKYELDLITTYAKFVDVTRVLPKCIRVFNKSLGFSCMHKIEKSFPNPKQLLRQNDLHSYLSWNFLKNAQPVEL